MVSLGTSSSRRKASSIPHYLLVAVVALLSASSLTGAAPIDDFSVAALTPALGPALPDPVPLISRADVGLTIQKRAQPFTVKNLVTFLENMGATKRGFYYTGWNRAPGQPGVPASRFVGPYTKENHVTWFNTITVDLKDDVRKRFGDVDLQRPEVNELISRALANFADSAETINAEHGAPGNFWDTIERPILKARGVPIKFLKGDAKTGNDYYAIEDKDGIHYEDGYGKGGKRTSPSQPGKNSGNPGSSGCSRKRDGACVVRGIGSGAVDAPDAFSDPLPGDMSYDPKAKKVYFKQQVYEIDSNGRLQNTATPGNDKGNAPDLKGMAAIHDLSQSEGYVVTSAGTFSIIEGAFMVQRQGTGDWIRGLTPAPKGLKDQNGETVMDFDDFFHGAVLVGDPTKGKGLLRMNAKELQDFLDAGDKAAEDFYHSEAAKRLAGQKQGPPAAPADNAQPQDQPNAQKAPQPGANQTPDNTADQTPDDTSDQNPEDPDTAKKNGNKPKQPSMVKPPRV